MHKKSPEFDFGTWALQDGLGFKKMKSAEILRNYKKLKYSKLQVSNE